MPRYRVIKPLPATLIYRGNVRLVLHRFESMYGGEQLAYRKDQSVPYRATMLCRGTPTNSVENQLANGFVVAANSPADRIMQSLVALSYAEQLHE